MGLLLSATYNEMGANRNRKDIGRDKVRRDDPRTTKTVSCALKRAPGAREFGGMPARD
jgi:hypothetical protein